MADPSPEVLALILAAQALHYEIAEWQDLTGETVAQPGTRLALAAALQRLDAPVMALPPPPLPWGEPPTTVKAYREWIAAGRPAAHPLD